MQSSNAPTPANMTMPLIDPGAPILSERAREVDFMNNVDIHGLCVIMKDSLIAHRGLGLSAPQIGVPLRVIVLGSPDDPASIMVMINPFIVAYSDSTSTDEEGCLTFPGLFLKVKRNTGVKVRYADASGNVETNYFSGLTARIIQHEIDHLDGVVFTKRANRHHLDSARTQQKKLNRERKRNLKMASVGLYNWSTDWDQLYPHILKEYPTND